MGRAYGMLGQYTKAVAAYKLAREAGHDFQGK